MERCRQSQRQYGLVRRPERLIRLRNRHPAFDGKFRVLDLADCQLRLAWFSAGERCVLDVDFASKESSVESVDSLGRRAGPPIGAADQVAARSTASASDAITQSLDSAAHGSGVRVSVTLRWEAGTLPAELLQLDEQA
jgi:hypothetical protein